MKAEKNKLVEQYLLPALGLTMADDARVLADLYQTCKLMYVVKYQVLESPEWEEEGRLWLPIDGMIHAYHYCQVSQRPQGMRIWKKRELILQPASLFLQQPLTDYIEVLEPGRVLSVGYQVLRDLMAGCPALFTTLLKAGLANERYYHRQIRLLQMPGGERLMLFEKENPLFVRIACGRLMAMHTGMSQRTYSELLRKINREKKC